MTQYTLRLSFDLRQVTQSLGHAFFLPNNDDYPEENSGPLASTFNFQQGDEIFVEVQATSATHTGGGVTPHDILETFKVTNCTLVSIPAHMTELLSLFDETSACATATNWGPIENVTTPEDKNANILRLSSRSQTALPVVTKNGQWQISGYLSVLLTSMDGQTRPQLYFFDPEGSAGNGGGFGKG